MIELDKAKEKAQRLADGFTLVSVRETSTAWIFEYKYYPGKEGVDGTGVVVDKRTGIANHIDFYTKEGYDLFRNAELVPEREYFGSQNSSSSS